MTAKPRGSVLGFAGATRARLKACLSISPDPTDQASQRSDKNKQRKSSVSTHALIMPDSLADVKSLSQPYCPAI